MLKDVTLGQFFPGQTPIHKLDPRTKLVLVIVYIVALSSRNGSFPMWSLPRSSPSSLP